MPNAAWCRPCGDAVRPRILIAGAGYIANEFAGIFNEFGTSVTISEV